MPGLFSSQKESSAASLLPSSAGRAARAAAAAGPSRFFLLLLLARFANQRLAREPDLVALDREHLDQHLVAQLQLIANVANAMLGNLTDVQQAVGAREQLDERSEFGETHYFAEIGFADFRRSGYLAHHLQRGIAARAAGRENVHRAVFQDFDLHAGRLDYRPDLLPARTNQVTNLIRRNVQLVQPRSEGRNRSTRLGQRLIHGVKNFQPRLLGLRQSLAHHADADAQNLDVHLQRGDSRARTGDFEVHVA